MINDMINEAIMLVLNLTEKNVSLYSAAINFEWKQVSAYTLATVACKIIFVERKCTVCEK